jgi:hypothetical protein
MAHPSPVEDTKPWYKHFWPWFLILVPLASMIFSINYFHLALTTENSLVVDDYYKEGRVINTRIDRRDAALKLNIKTELDIRDGAIALRFISGVPTTGEALELGFYHTTMAAKDFKVLLSRDAQGVYRGSYDVDINSKWQMTLMPLDQSWKVQQTRFLPQAKPFAFVP